MNKVLLRHGTLAEQACQLCYRQRTRFGTLIDPNGHAWLICDRCINRLWDKRTRKRQKVIESGRQ